MCYFDTEINVGEVSALMVGLGRSGRKGQCAPGVLLYSEFPAPDICPNRYNNLQKTHFKFTNSEATLRDYFPLNPESFGAR